MTSFERPIIDVAETAAAIKRTRIQKGYSVRDIQTFLSFEYPQAIYAWEKGEYLPSIDNLVVLSSVLGVAIEDLVKTRTIEVSVRDNRHTA